MLFPICFSCHSFRIFPCRYLRTGLAKHSIKLVSILQGRWEWAKVYGATQCQWPHFLSILIRLNPQHSFTWLERLYAELHSCHTQQSLHHTTPPVQSGRPVPHITSIPLDFQPQEHSCYSTFFPWWNPQLLIQKKTLTFLDQYISWDCFFFYSCRLEQLKLYT